MSKVLVIEDDRVVARIYQTKLQGVGHEVEAAHDGEEGIKVAESFAPDVIVLDLGLPKANGVEVLRKIRASAKGANTPVVVMSNSYVTELVQAAWKAGATKCLNKTSCTPAQLVDLVNGALIGNKPKPMAPAAAESMATADLAGANSQEEVRKAFLRDGPGWVGALRQRFQHFTRGSGQSVGELIELYRAVHSLTGNAGIAGFEGIAKLSAATEALLKELNEQPKKIGPSPIRTIAAAIDSLAERLTAASVSAGDDELPSMALVIDDDRVSRTMISAALERVKMRHITLADPTAALQCAKENSFDLIFTDVRMPAITGFDLCTQLRRMERHKKTPIVFVTAADDFEARASSKLSGGTDLIGKPFLLAELAVKALTYVGHGS